MSSRTQLILLDILKGAKEPMTPVELADMPNVREAVLADYGIDSPQAVANKVSNLLGNMSRNTRHAQVARHHAPHRANDRSQYAYSIAAPDTAPAAAKHARPTIAVVQKGDSVVIEVGEVLIVVKPNPKRRNS
jgi:hypothetical protein